MGSGSFSGFLMLCCDLVSLNFWRFRSFQAFLLWTIKPSSVYMSFACFGLHPVFCCYSTGILCIWSMDLWWLPRLRRRGSMRGAVPLGLPSGHTQGQEPVCGTCALWPLAAARAAALRALRRLFCVCACSMKPWSDVLLSAADK